TPPRPRIALLPDAPARALRAQVGPPADPPRQPVRRRAPGAPHAGPQRNRGIPRPRCRRLPAPDWPTRERLGCNRPGGVGPRAAPAALADRAGPLRPSCDPLDARVGPESVPRRPREGAPGGALRALPRAARNAGERGDRAAPRTGRPRRRLADRAGRIPADRGRARGA